MVEKNIIGLSRDQRELGQKCRTVQVDMLRYEINFV